MAKKDLKKSVSKKEIEGTQDINTLFNDLLTKITKSTNVPVNDKNLDHLVRSVDEIVSSELDSLEQYGGQDISKFFNELFRDTRVPVIGGSTNILDLDESAMKTFINNNYKSKYLLYQDLKNISEKLFELDEAILTTRDSIVTSDDMDSAISRTLSFENHNDEDVGTYISEIEKLEKKYNLMSKIKNHIVTKTLIYGKYYAYTIPYTKMIEDYVNRISRDTNGRVFDITRESAGVKEALSSDYFKSGRGNKKEFEAVLGNVKISNSPIPLPCVLENLDVDMFMETIIESNFDNDSEEFKALRDKSIKNSDKSFKAKKQPKQPENFYAELIGIDSDFKLKNKGIEELYIELVEPLKIVPLKIMNKIIGYYYIYSKDFNISNLATNSRTSVLTSTIYNRVGDSEDIVTKLSDVIVKNLNKPFIENNEGFKDIIASALRYYDIKNRQVTIQFIPPEYITEFKVNLDEEDEGTSVLLKSLFYAKLYLSILIFKIIAILTRSNDTRVYYVKQSPAEKDVTNKVNETIRSTKEKQVNFLDIMNSNSMLSKVGAMRDMYIPTGASGDKSLDIDIISGQDIQLNTDLMEMLRTNMISATGVPSVIMNYVNEADYAKTLVMANTKFLGRVISLQLDFNPSITEFYKKIIRFSNILQNNNETKNSLIESFEYTLTKPKSLNNNNLGDLINNTESVITFITKIAMGDNAEPGPMDNKIRDIALRELAKVYLPMLPWDDTMEIIKKATIEATKKEIEKAATSTADNQENY
ncbi:MAG: hypothetical protein PHF63_00405 [Herbinix sp.]|nr:hypothetical protein [Herbinix sp.]